MRYWYVPGTLVFIAGGVATLMTLLVSPSLENVLFSLGMMAGGALSAAYSWLTGLP